MKPRYDFAEFCVCVRCRGELRAEEGALVCRACSRRFEVKDGVAVLTPEYDDPELRSRYQANYDVLAQDDLREPVEEYRAARHAPFVRFVGKVRGKRVLDVGSSAGDYLDTLQAGFKVALDLALPYLRAIPAERGIARVCSDAEFLPFKPGFFDVIVLSDVLEHVLHPEAVVARLLALAGPRTRVIVHIPWREDISVYAKSKYEFVHLRSFDPQSFAELWKGFVVKKVKGTYPAIREPLVFRLESRLPRFLYNLLVLAHFNGFAGLEERMRLRWAKELPRRERWLLRFYDPVYRMYDLRLAPRRSLLAIELAKRLLRRLGLRSPAPADPALPRPG